MHPAVPGFIVALGIPAQQQTSTVISTLVSTIQGPSTGIDPSAFYGAVAVAVIFLVTTGVLAIRLRKPAP